MNEKLHKFTGTEHTSEGWQDIQLETGCTYSYGDFHEYKGEVTEALKKSLFLMPSLMSGSDYNGGSVNLSNKRSFLKLYGEVEGVYEVEGGYNTYGIVIRLDVYESNADIKKILDELDNYPLVDEEDHSALENEWDCEYMTDILIPDLISNIDLETYIHDYEKLLEDKEALEHLAWDGMNDLSLQMGHETNSSYLRSEDTSKLQCYIEDRLLLDHCTELPMLVGREWSHKDLRQKFLDKFKQ